MQLVGYLAAVVLLAQARQSGLSFDEVYPLVREPIARFALKLLGDPDEAADVAQETALAIWNGLDRFEGRSSPTSWALGIVANLARKRLRRKRIEPTLVAPGTVDAATTPRTAEALEAREELERVQQLLAQLSEQQRAVFLLVTEGRLSYAQIAEALDMSVANVKVTMHRARKRLLAALETA